MLIPETTKQHSETQVHLQITLLLFSALDGAESKYSYLCVNHVAHGRSQEVDQLLLDDRQLGEESVLLASENRVSESTKAQSSSHAFKLAIREDIR